MKLKITEKQIRSWGGKRLVLTQGRNTEFLSHLSPQYYTCGVYGWNSDVYVFDDNILLIGYRPMKGNIECPLSTVKKVNEQISKLFDSKFLKEETKINRMYKIINKLFD